TAQSVAAIADAIVVGSRMVLTIEASNEENLIENVTKLMQELRAAIDAT
ncbi:MAG: tryptophan synthase subunit alpha, partial [Methylophilales bacterium 28-44-11]